MRNKSLMYFIIFSVATHAALVWLWPDKKELTPQGKDGSIEIGMVILPRIDKNFTRDSSQLQQVKPSTQNKQSESDPDSSTINLKSHTADSHVSDQLTIEKSKQLVVEVMSAKRKKSVSPYSRATVSATINSNPVSATKAAPLFSMNPSPTYPDEALRYGWEGEVWLRVIVTSSGEVGDIVIEQSSDYQILDQAAIKTVRSWLFEPARIGSDTTEGAVRIPIRFKIKRS